jgi:acetyl esterase/lipase
MGMQTSLEPQQGTTLQSQISKQKEETAVSRRTMFFDIRPVAWIMLALLSVTALGASPQAMRRVVGDIQYFTGGEADPDFHTLDLYLPDGESDLPLIFFVHGGSWRTGDKSQEGRVSFIDLFLSRGMAVASINYRLYPGVKHPAQIQDVARAFSWIYQNAAQYGIDPDNLFIAGQSAGGHLVSLLALDPKYLKEEGLSPGRIKGVITISGMYDLVNVYQMGSEPDIREQVFGKDRDSLGGASPALKVGNASSDTPPFLITYANNELFGFDEQAKTFYSLLLNHNRPARLVKLPARDHNNVVSTIGKQVPIKDLNGTPIVQVEDLLGPAMIGFVKNVQDGSFIRSFHAVWPEGGPTAVPEMPSPQMRMIKDIQYYQGAGADPKLNALDLYLPEGKTNFPLLFHVHGGRWRVGDKNLDTLVTVLGRLGWGIASTNYRLLRITGSLQPSSTLPMSKTWPVPLPGFTRMPRATESTGRGSSSMVIQQVVIWWLYWLLILDI